MVTATIINGTMNTIPTNRLLLSRWWMAFVAILLMIMGIPSLAARLVLRAGDEIQLSILQGNSVSDEDLTTLAAGRRAISSWFHLNAAYNDLALSSLERSGRVTDKIQAANLLKEAVAWQYKALFVSPADPYGWYRLSYLYFVTEGPSQRAAGAWKQSLNAASYEPRLLVTRVQMAMSLGNVIDTETRSQLPRMVREAWDEDPDLLLRTARDGSFLSFVESSLADDAESLEQFHRLTKSAE